MAEPVHRCSHLFVLARTRRQEDQHRAPCHDGVLVAFVGRRLGGLGRKPLQLVGVTKAMADRAREQRRGRLRAAIRTGLLLLVGLVMAIRALGSDVPEEQDARSLAEFAVLTVALSALSALAAVPVPAFPS